MLKINQLHKSFNNIEILKGITAEFNNGETSLIIGQSGSGKTVLLKCLLDLYSYDKGDIYYGNQELNELSENEKMKLKSKIGTVFQGSALFDSMNIEENVPFVIEQRKQKSFSNLGVHSTPKYSVYTKY